MNKKLCTAWCPWKLEIWNPAELVKGTVLARQRHCEATQLLAVAASETSFLPLQQL